MKFLRLVMAALVVMVVASGVMACTKAADTAAKPAEPKTTEAPK